MAGEDATHKGKSALLGSLITAYVLLDAYVIGLPVMFLAAWGKPLVVFALAAAGVILINIVVCGWIDRHWDSWISSGYGKKIEKRIDKMRSGRIMRHPVAWIERGSDAWFALAAALLNAATVVVAARLIGGKPVGAHRILVASVGYGLFFAALFSLIGFVAGDAIRAL
jgi:hypothetical protein